MQTTELHLLSSYGDIENRMCGETQILITWCQVCVKDKQFVRKCVCVSVWWGWEVGGTGPRAIFSFHGDRNEDCLPKLWDNV